MNKSLIPNIFTFLNLSMGIIAITFCFKDGFLIAGILILVAAFLDRYDGKIARKLGAVSDFGKELDSLSDLVSFGVAPALLVWKTSMFNLGIVGYVLLLAFSLAGAFRLARFNVTECSKTYIGIPITVAGSLAAIDSIIAVKLAVHTEISVILMIALSFFMVSTIKFKKI